MMESSDNRVKEYLKWRERVVKSLPDIANRVLHCVINYIRDAAFIIRLKGSWVLL